MGNGTITSEDLMYKLAKAKKVMNKVETGNYETDNIDRDMLSKSPEELMESKNLPKPTTIPANNGNVDISRIKNSKLPDAIKQAMIDNPIQQISLNDSLDMNFVKNAKRIMEQEGVATKKPIKKPQEQYTPKNIEYNNSDLMTQLSPIIENIIRKVLDEKLTQILTAQTTSSINENLVLRVGDSIFKGKITGVNKAK